jgi:hypothetical protein
MRDMMAMPVMHPIPVHRTMGLRVTGEVVTEVVEAAVVEAAIEIP